MTPDLAPDLAPILAIGLPPGLAVWLLLLAWVWPLLLVAVQASAPWQGGRADTRAAGMALGPRRAGLLWLGPIPALIAALIVPLDTTLTLPWLLLGTTLTLDATARVYLLFTAILWLAAGSYAAWEMRPSRHGRRFAALFLLAMAGNLWLIIGADLISFYAGFALMGVAAYGLIIHDASPAARRAGRVYLVMAMFGEMCLFAAIVLTVAQTGSVAPTPTERLAIEPLTIGLGLIGLGIKAGLVPLHLWLPLSYPAAPIAASVVLAGTMSKVALLGWLRLLPVGSLAMPDWGAVFATAGLAALLFALPVGLVQTAPRAVLAYSSISKMGLMVLLLGLILLEPALAPIGIAALVFYAAFHALAKGGLFMGVGLYQQAVGAADRGAATGAETGTSDGSAPYQQWRPWILGGLIFLSLALVGAPFTSGAVAKYEVKPLLDAAQWTWLSALLAVTTVGTTLLMARFVALNLAPRPAGTASANGAAAARPPAAGARWPVAAWGLLLGLSLLLPLAFGTPAAWLTNALWVPLGIAFAAAGWGLARVRPGWFRRLPGSIPPGDLVVLVLPMLRTLDRFGRALGAPLRRLFTRIDAGASLAFARVFGPPGGDAEAGLRLWPVAGILWIGLTLLLLLTVLGPADPEANSPTAPANSATSATTEPLTDPTNGAGTGATTGPTGNPGATALLLPTG